jgi:hypothetical protein
MNAYRFPSWLPDNKIHPVQEKHQKCMHATKCLAIQNVPHLTQPQSDPKKRFDQTVLQWFATKIAHEPKVSPTGVMNRRIPLISSS